MVCSDLLSLIITTRGIVQIANLSCVAAPVAGATSAAGSGGSSARVTGSAASRASSAAGAASSAAASAALSAASAARSSGAASAVGVQQYSGLVGLVAVFLGIM